MLKKKKFFKVTIFTTLTLSILLTSSQPQALLAQPTTYYSDYDINNNPRFATINEQDIYIVKKDYSININDNNIYIIDLRSEDDNIKILNSYHINKYDLRNEIINIILKYNEMYPTEKAWVRSRKSLNNEWLIHNILYYFYLFRDHTKDVDFETNEEKRYLLS